MDPSLLNNLHLIRFTEKFLVITNYMLYIIVKNSITGDPADLENNYGNSKVVFSKIRIGEIGSTYPGEESFICNLYNK